jgi:membrane fusion protein, copper/silver efflux system
MSRLLERHRRLVIGACVLALGLAVVVAQYARAAWPFARSSAHLSHLNHGEVPTVPNADHPHAGMDMNAAGAVGALPRGYAAVTVDPARIPALQLASVPVEESDFTRVVRSVGVVTLDETRTAHVHSKVRGWIDGIFVDFVGRKVKAGEPLCSIYSQEVYAAEIEFLSILDRGTHRTAPDPLLDAARRRLSLWDVPPSEVARLEATREPRRTFPLLAPRAGVVVSKEAVQGMFVDSALELYTLSDLSRLWVLVDAYEGDVPYVRVGARAVLTIEGVSAPIESKVAFLAPTIDEATRTRKVRFELDNKEGRLLPGAFVSAEMTLSLGRGLAVPESAVIRTGARSLVFVSHGSEGAHLEPREITLGPLVGDRYRVQTGLSAGERVATGAQFLLDSESRLRATSSPAGAHAH